MSVLRCDVTHLQSLGKNDVKHSDELENEDK